VHKYTGQAGAAWACGLGLWEPSAQCQVHLERPATHRGCYSVSPATLYHCM